MRTRRSSRAMAAGSGSLRTSVVAAASSGRCRPPVGRRCPCADTSVTRRERAGARIIPLCLPRQISRRGCSAFQPTEARPSVDQAGPGAGEIDHRYPLLLTGTNVVFMLARRCGQLSHRGSGSQNGPATFACFRRPQRAIRGFGSSRCAVDQTLQRFDSILIRSK